MMIEFEDHAECPPMRLRERAFLTVIGVLSIIGFALQFVGLARWLYQLMN